MKKVKKSISKNKIKKYKTSKNKYKGKYYIVRTYSTGVFAGYMESFITW